MSIWDERYRTAEFIYGKEPNCFFAEQLQKLLIGKILLPAEGEGRNAVYAAKKGWDVTAIDSSFVAKEKALAFAQAENVTIDYQIQSIEEYRFPQNEFDAVALIYAHQKNHENLHRNCINSLKKGGTILLEAFSKQQIHYSSGGPGDVNLLYSIDELMYDFKDLFDLTIWEEDVQLNEGKGHAGMAHVIRLIGKK